MGRLYLSYQTIGATLALDLVEITAPADARVRVHSWMVWQETEVGEAEEEIFRLETVRGLATSTSGSGGSAPTPQPLQDGDPAFGGTFETVNNTRMSGDVEVLEQFGWNGRVPKRRVYTPETRPILLPSHRWTLALANAPNDLMTIGVHIIFEEMGG